MLALILSILLPGLGQFYYGKNGRAILMLLAALTPLYPLALIWSIIDVLRLNKQGLQPKFEAREAVWAIVLVLVIIPLCLVVAFSGMFALGKWYSNSFISKNATLEEGERIVSILQSHHANSGKYPKDLNSLIEGIPVRSGWKTDAWGEAYFYEVENGGDGFRLVSKGKDRIFGTEDDLVFE